MGSFHHAISQTDRQLLQSFWCGCFLLLQIRDERLRQWRSDPPRTCAADTPRPDAALHLAGPLRIDIEPNEFVHVMRHPRQHSPGIALVRAAAPQPPDSALARQAVTDVVHPAAQAEQDGKLGAVEVDVDFEPLRGIGWSCPVSVDS